MNKRVLFVCSQKGGAGKTTFARGLLEALRYEGHTVAAYDADGPVGQLLQYEGLRDRKGRLIPRQDPQQGCGHFDIREADDRDLLLNALAGDPPVLLFDLPGGVVGELGKVLDEGRHLLPDPEEAVCPPELALEAWLRRVYDLMRTVGGIGVPGEPTLRKLQDRDAPTPQVLSRDAYLLARAGLKRPRSARQVRSGDAKSLYPPSRR